MRGLILHSIYNNLACLKNIKFKYGNHKMKYLIRLNKTTKMCKVKK